MTVSPPDPIELSARVTTRICHDLVSPIGAVDNGVELMAEMGAGAPSPELALIAESARAAVRKVQLFRIAFGPSEGAPLDPGALRGLVEQCFEKPRQSVMWRCDGQALDRPSARLLVLCAMCCDSAMARGGLLRVEPRGTALRLMIEGERLRIEDDLWAWLSPGGGAGPLPAPGEIHFPLAAEAAASLARIVTWEEVPGGLVLRIRPT